MKIFLQFEIPWFNDCHDSSCSFKIAGAETSAVGHAQHVHCAWRTELVILYLLRTYHIQGNLVAVFVFLLFISLFFSSLPIYYRYSINEARNPAITACLPACLHVNESSTCSLIESNHSGMTDLRCIHLPRPALYT